MLNVVFIYALSLFLITKAIGRTNDSLTIGILLILAVCLFFGFFCYIAIFLLIPGTNAPGLILITAAACYLGSQ